MPEEKSFDLSGGPALEMVKIEPGTFQMGSPETEPGRWPDEGSVREVKISTGYYLGKIPVTQAQWEAVMGTQPWHQQDFVKEGGDHPAAYVSWEDAAEFISKLNDLQGDGFRLPTEAEWEHACRAGTTTPWFFGDDAGLLDKHAWFRDNAWDAGQPYAHAAGQKEPNRWGLHDLYGNVWEWCQDLYGAYPDEPQSDPTGAEKGNARVLRGSGFASEARALRSAFRYSYSPGRRFHCIGLRLARAAD
jgi:formylglycine-generating enzyme required for sulfatase activity